MELGDFLDQNYHMFIPVLWVLGYALKQTPKVPNWSILWILFGASLGFGIYSFGFSIDAIINGILAAGVAVFGHQMFKQTATARTERQQKKTVELEQQAFTDKNM
ncbi:phage holin family protein [Fredinandcohnia sp. 179-A 10B2 NHS]|uniref:phage holin family protein n=1 Tax=Fredinandcohnia sp. 179-A 10B2 NHS TaxID=3235176 RepID=UPI0039A0F45E